MAEPTVLRQAPNLKALTLIYWQQLKADIILIFSYFSQKIRLDISFNKMSSLIFCEKALKLKMHTSQNFSCRRLFDV